MTASGDREVRPDLLRQHHDPSRPAVDTGQAAEIEGKTRQAIVDAIHAGRLDGYGIAGPKRTRWYVYRDSLGRPSPQQDADLAARIAHLERENTALRETNLWQQQVMALQQRIAGADEQVADALDGVPEMLRDAAARLERADEGRKILQRTATDATDLLARLLAIHASPDSPEELDLLERTRRR